MRNYVVGDRVRVDVPNQADIDHRLHGNHGEVVEIISDDAADLTGRDQDSDIFRVQLDDSGDTVDLRRRDLRPPFKE